mgnify:CR=1 FL=1
MLYEELLNRQSMRDYLQGNYDEDFVNSEQAYLLRVVSGVIRNRLTRRQREITLLYYKNGLTMEQIAEQLHLNKSTVSRHLARTREKIKGILACFYDPI